MYTAEFKRYKDDVVRDFVTKQREAKEGWLIRPTRARIKVHCIDLIDSGLESRYENTLRYVLNMKLADTEFLITARKAIPDDFKTIEEFLKKLDKETAEENVEFLAWLIAFPHGPFSYYKTNKQETPPVQVETQPPTTAGNRQDDVDTPEVIKPKKKLPWWSFAEAAGLLIVVLLQFHFVNVVKVYVCDSRTAAKYHFKSNCSGLNRCTHPIIKIDEEDAKKRGLVACKFESR